MHQWMTKVRGIASKLFGMDALRGNAGLRDGGIFYYFRKVYGV